VNYLIDTNVISEVRKGSRCDANVARWYASIDDNDLYLSVLILGEIRRGIELARRRDPAQAAALQDWLAAVDTAFGERVLPVDRNVADAWGRMNSHRPLPTVDSLLAATAVVHGMTLVTRNDTDVSGVGAKVLNPFVEGTGT
jgi:toxin FitB